MSNIITKKTRLKKIEVDLYAGVDNFFEKKFKGNNCIKINKKLEFFSNTALEIHYNIEEGELDYGHMLIGTDRCYYKFDT